MADTKTILISSLSASLIIMAGMLGIDYFNTPHYYCADKPELGFNTTCDRFSSTGNRCYPYPDTTKGYKDCSSGWSKVVYDINETPETINIISSNTQSNAQKEICTKDGCEAIA